MKKRSPGHAYKNFERKCCLYTEPLYPVIIGKGDQKGCLVLFEAGSVDEDLVQAMPNPLSINQLSIEN